MQEELKNYKTNQSGTLSNRTIFYNQQEKELFTVEFRDDVDNPERYKIVSQLKSAPELYEALEIILYQFEINVPGYEHHPSYQLGIAAIKKAKGE